MRRFLSMRFVEGQRGRPLHYAFAALLVAVAAGLRQLVSGFLPPALIFLTYFPAVMVAALVGGLGPGVLATLLSAISVNYFLVIAARELVIDSTGKLVTLLVFSAIGVAISWLASAVDEKRRQVAEETRRLALIVNASGDAIVGKTVEGIVTSWNPGA